MPRSRNAINGEHLAQLSNRNPFAVPVWRSPVYRTPEGVILAVQLLRLAWRVAWFALAHRWQMRWRCWWWSPGWAWAGPAWSAWPR